ncbi:MAG: NADH-quinone oxidoreductase subunit A [Bacteroidetes bacterium]|nr:NADH-quinone oxidoreductase subunit A [Bacteroidota bacterium]
MKEQSLVSDYIPILIQLCVAIGFVVATMLATHLIGPKRKGANKLESFECGIESEGNARLPFSVKYFLTAILFVLFDVEVIFMYPWAVNYKTFLHEMGMQGFFSMVIFLSLFLVGFYYIVRKGALKWE